MEQGLFNISSVTTTTLVEKQEGFGSIESITICNGSANAAVVTLFLTDGTNSTSIVDTLTIPSGVTLCIDDGLAAFNSRRLSLKLTNTGSSPELYVIIK